jgi:hypothetical protein
MNEEGEFLHLLFFLSHLYVATNSSRSRLNLAPIFQETRKGLADQQERKSTDETSRKVRSRRDQTHFRRNKHGARSHGRRKKRCNRLSMARRAGTKLPRPFADESASSEEAEEQLQTNEEKRLFLLFFG